MHWNDTNDPHDAVAMTARAADGRTSHPLPLVDIVAHARSVHSVAGNRRSDVLTTVTIYGAAVLATAGFVLAAVVDEILRPPMRPRRARA